MMAFSAPSERSRPTSKGHFMNGVDEDLQLVPGIKFIDHVAIAVKQGELEVNGRGISTDIIEASAKAYLDALGKIARAKKVKI